MVHNQKSLATISGQHWAKGVVFDNENHRRESVANILGLILFTTWTVGFHLAR